nr:MAG TPA: hypothetical protein [Caudoviricetes sp.]
MAHIGGGFPWKPQKTSYIFLYRIMEPNKS